MPGEGAIFKEMAVQISDMGLDIVVCVGAAGVAPR